MCLALLSNTDAVWLDRPCDTASGFQRKLRLPTSNTPRLIPIIEACRREVRCKGSADHTICQLPSCRGRPASRRKLLSGDIVDADVEAIIHLPEQRNHSSVNPSPRCRYTPHTPHSLSVSIALSCFLSCSVGFSFSLTWPLSNWMGYYDG